MAVPATSQRVRPTRLSRQDLNLLLCGNFMPPESAQFDHYNDDEEHRSTGEPPFHNCEKMRLEAIMKMYVLSVRRMESQGIASWDQDEVPFSMVCPPELFRQVRNHLFMVPQSKPAIPPFCIPRLIGISGVDPK